MAAVEKDLAGVPFDKKLVWRTAEGLAVQPFYRREDLGSLGYLRDQAPGAFPFVRGKKGEDNRWLICQPVTRTAVGEANQVARRALAAGADAVAFRSSTCEGRLYGQRVTSLADFAALFDGIDLAKVPVHLDWGSAGPQAAAYLVAHAEARGVKPSQLSGSVEFDPLRAITASGQLPEDLSAYWDGVAAFLKEARAALPSMRLVVLHTDLFTDAGSNLAEDLALVLAQGVELVSALTDRGFTAEEALALIGVKASVANNYFMEIAFFRALRLTWASVASAFGVEGGRGKVWVHGETASVDKTLFDPQVNILRQTTAAMSAVIGGVDVLSVRPYDEPVGVTSEASERLARNTQLVLREESGLDHAVDPAAGSYFLENLTDALAARAFSLFQELEAKGGYLAALADGTVRAWIESSRAELDKGVAARRIALLGTNQYPNAAERVSERLVRDGGTPLSGAALGAAPSSFSALVALARSGALPLGDGLTGASRAVPAVPPPRRLGAAYEDLRLAVEALSPRPSVYLWTFGGLAMRKARASFCQNLYACAGFAVVEGSGSDDAAVNLDAIAEAGARFVVFCSSDDEYPVKVPELISALRGRFPEVVPVVAGLPKDGVETLKAAGVAEFVHVRTEAIDYLKSCVARVGGAL
jgi:methylmalonyl-CoA mutase